MSQQNNNPYQNIASQQAALNTGQRDIMDIEIDISLTTKEIVFPPPHSNFQYLIGFTNRYEPHLLTDDDIAIMEILPFKALPPTLIQFINTMASKNTASFFRLIHLQEKLKTLHEHKAADTFPKHYKVKISAPNNTLISSEQLSLLALSSILSKDLQKTQSDFTTRFALLRQTNVQLLLDCHSRIKGIADLIDNESLRSDYESNPILEYYFSQISNTIVRFNQNTINHQNKAELEKAKKIDKQQKFQDSLRKQSALLTTADTPNVHNEPALLQKELQSLRSMLSKNRQGKPKNVKGAPNTNTSSPPSKVPQSTTANKKKKLAKQKQPQQQGQSQNSNQKKKKNQRNATTGNATK